MSKFRKKPVVIEARQFITNNEPGPAAPQMDALVLWMNQGRNGRDGAVSWHNGTDIFIETLEGQHTAQCGDWIIQGVSGEFYPCKPDIFEQTYEPVDD